MQDHSGGDSVALGEVILSSPSWDLGSLLLTHTTCTCVGVLVCVCVCVCMCVPVCICACLYLCVRVNNKRLSARVSGDAP